MFNSSGRLVICNQRYLEMYALSPEIVKPGYTFRELLDYRIARGNNFNSTDPEQYIADLQTAIAQANYCQ